ncbi:MAG TPA: MG2 domain-containing protein [Bacteroidia bacterium]|nr:MG2 domain-containing protein [Bacteroidia bacterium]
MKRISVLLFAAICAAVLFSACNGGKLKVKEVNFSNGEVQVQQAIVFTFSQDLVTDSNMHKWDSTHYLDFKPAVPGVYEWVSANQLSFSPSQAFLNNTDYKVTLTKKLLSHTKKSMSIDDKPIEFHTPYLKLDNVETFWTLKNANSSLGVFVGVTLVFNYPVAPAAVMQKLKLTQNNTVVQPELVSADDGKEVKLLFKPVDGETYPCVLNINIDAGLRCLGSEKLTTKPITNLSQIPPKDQFEIISATPTFENGQSYITVTTTQPVVAEGIEQFVSMSPTVNYKIKMLSNGFTINGDFSNKKDYTLTLSGKLKNIFGIELKTDYKTDIHFGTPPPYIAFEDKNSIYISSQGNRNLGVQIISVPKVTFSIFKIYKNNILQYLKRGQQYQWYDDPQSSGDESGDGEDEGYDGGYHSSYDYAPDASFGDVIATREFNSSSLQTNGMTSLLNIDLSEFKYDGAFKGIYMVQVQDKKKPWVQDRKLLVISDIGLIVKKGEKEIYVFCHSLLNATKMSGVKVTFVSNNNQEIYSATTDGDGVAKFEYDKSKYPGSDVAAIIASSGNDFSFMNLQDNTINMSPFDIGGKPSLDVPYDAFMYSNRDLYRPGDTININTIVRTFDWHTTKDVPVKYKITMPNGKQLQEIKGKLDEQGSCAISFFVPTAAMTGSYNVEMYSGNDVFLKSYSFMVEEFMPQRIKVTVNSDATEYNAGQPVTINVQANELFGPPAANKNWQSTLDLDFESFYAPKFSDYNFYITRPKDVNFEQMTNEGQTDDKGAANITYDLPEVKNVGLLTGKAIVTVFDETGRPVNREQKFKVYTQKVFYGIKDFDSWVSSTSPLFIYFAAVDKKGDEVAKAHAYVQVIKHTWETVLTNTYNSYRYESQEVTRTVYYKDLDVVGKESNIAFTPQESGDYEVRISPDPSCNSYVSKYFWAYGSGNTQFNSFQVSKEGNVQIKADKETYKPGEDAKMLFTCPFEGELIVTVEQNDVKEKYFVHTDHKAASLSIPIKGDYLPGVYISASLIRELSDNSIPLTIARGFIPIKVEEPSNKLSVQISAVDNSRSQTDQVIKVKTDPNAEVTIGVVDEGILQITNFQTPDPYAYFYGKRALGVSTYDIYPRVLPELMADMSSMAGGEAMEGRTNPTGGKRVVTLAYWSGILKTGSSGECSYKIHIPQFSGSLRVMAVAYKDNKFGSSDHNIIVADPLVVSTSLPRFLSPNDQNTLNVAISNTTNKKVSAVANISTTGPLQVCGSHSESVDIPAHTEKDVTFQLNATANVNPATVDVSVKANGETFTDHEEVPVRPAMPMEKVSDGGVAQGGETKDINFTTKYANTTKGYILVSKSPLVQFNKNLGSLLNYPYGCMEQTVSTAFPVLYYNALVKALGQKEENQRYNPTYIINAAIKKIYSAQQYDGGLSYWPGMGDMYESWWCSIYACHFLLEAKKAGYDVDNSVVDNLIQYINGQVNTKKTDTYWYYDNNGKLQQKLIAPEEVFYSLYVLAIAGHPNIPTMNYFKTQTELMTLDSKYMLAASYALTGDMRAFAAMLPQGFSGERATRAFSGSFYSYMRDESISLATLLQAQPNNSQIPILARHISDELKKDEWYSTQENAFALIALGKFSENAIKSTASASVYIDGAKVGDLASDQVSLVIHQDVANRKVEIKTSGSGYVYYYYETYGIPLGDQFKEDDSYLKVRKSFYAMGGTPITNMSLKQNQMVVVKVHIESLDYRNVENVAITDIIPACFEIENPRINPERDMKWITEASTPDFMDIRDDRITFFTTASQGKGNDFYYLVRVVAKGKYIMGPVGADAMYDGSYHSYNGSGTVVVE